MTLARRRFPYFSMFAALACAAASACAVSARTIELTDFDCDRMAVISPQIPLSGWAGAENVPGQFTSSLLDLQGQRVFLVRYPLDRIPTGQRIVRAEWIVPVDLIAGAGEAKIYVRRVLGPWGKGVCYDFRTRVPKPVPWGQAGARGVATDRAAQPTAIVSVSETAEVTINVTEDVELWNTGAAENQGWLMTVEHPTALVRLASPLWTGVGRYKLRVTYEPE
ncbi:MAG: hypothetical protein K8U03_13935 [Planctomycetia bacterium]|nr:hypothetical protein [Planctomycetia bacterium]